MSGLVRLKRLDLGTRRRGFGKASLISFKVNPRLRLGLTLNSTRLALLGSSLQRLRRHTCRRYHLDRVLPYELDHRADELIGLKVDVSGELSADF